jgi:hypothetical protein
MNPRRAGVFPEEAVGGRSGHGSSTEGRGERSPDTKRPGSPGRVAADGGNTPSGKTRILIEPTLDLN